MHPGGGEPRLHAQVHNLYGSLMAQAAREGLRAPAAGPAPVRDHPRGLRRAAAPRAAVDGRQLVLVGAPVDEHAAAAEPRAVGRRAGCGVDVGGFFGDCNGELLARWTEFGIFQPFCRNHSGNGHARRRSRGRSASRGRRVLPRHAAAADAAAAVPVQRCSRRRTAPARRSCGRCCSSTPTTRRPTRPTTSSCSATRCCVAPITRPGHRAPARLPARRHVGAVVDRRACRRARRTCSRTRRSGRPGAVRARQRADPAVAASATTPARRARRADAADLRRRGRAGRRARRCTRTRARATARAPAAASAARWPAAPSP